MYGCLCLLCHQSSTCRTSIWSFDLYFYSYTFILLLSGEEVYQVGYSPKTQQTLLEPALNSSASKRGPTNIYRIQWRRIQLHSTPRTTFWRSVAGGGRIHEVFIGQLQTVAVEAEAVTNSWPLVPLSENPNDGKALTPSHFLVGTSLKAPQSQV